MLARPFSPLSHRLKAQPFKLLHPHTVEMEPATLLYSARPLLRQPLSQQQLLLHLVLVRLSLSPLLPLALVLAWLLPTRLAHNRRFQCKPAHSLTLLLAAPRSKALTLALALTLLLAQAPVNRLLAIHTAQCKVQMAAFPRQQ
jgi:hypothetical protein